MHKAFLAVLIWNLVKDIRSRFGSGYVFLREQSHTYIVPGFSSSNRRGRKHKISQNRKKAPFTSLICKLLSLKIGIDLRCGDRKWE